MFTLISTLMADASHVFIIRQEQIRSEKGTRSPYALTLLCFICIGLLSVNSVYSLSIENSIDSLTPAIQTNSDYAELNKPFIIKCIANSTVNKPILNWYLPTDLNGFIHYTTEDDRNDEMISTKILILVIFRKPKPVFTVRCTARLKNSPFSLSITNQNINIYYEPILLNKNYHWDYGVGGNSVFICKFEANPNCVIQWNKNDQSLDVDAARQVITQSNVAESQISSLTTNEIIYKDYAQYSCVCENQIGLAKEVFQIPNDYGRLNDNCFDHVDCFVDNSFCNFQTKKCQCKNGYQQPLAKFSEENNSFISLNSLDLKKCIKVAKLNEKCTSNQHCMIKFSTCNRTTQTCQCNSNYIAIKINGSLTCHPIIRELFSNCIHDQQCTTEGSKCIDKFCFCDDFHKPYWENGSCIQKTFIYSVCSEDLCQRGGFAYSSCVNNSCQCSDGYYYNKSTHHCEGYDAYGIFLLLTFITALVMVCFVPFFSHPNNP